MAEIHIGLLTLHSDLSLEEMNMYTNITIYSQFMYIVQGSHNGVHNKISLYLNTIFTLFTFKSIDLNKY